MGSKTRDRLIEVARQLFARQGVENTTMLDIANASEKGRRTIYTYFRNKREIHRAVIERESEQAVSVERSILACNAPAREKLERLLRARFETLLCPAAPRYAENLRRLNLLDGRKVSETRRLTALKELQILSQILREGMESGEFRAEAASDAVPMIVMVMLGVDNTVTHHEIEVLGISREEAFDSAVRFILRALDSNSSGGDKTAGDNNPAVANNSTGCQTEQPGDSVPQ